MDEELLQLIQEDNPWLTDAKKLIIGSDNLIFRNLTDQLLSPINDRKWLVLTGPRGIGKTTLAKFIAQQLIQRQRFKTLLYLDCSKQKVRKWLKTTNWLETAINFLHLQRPVCLVDNLHVLDNSSQILLTILNSKFTARFIATTAIKLRLHQKTQMRLQNYYIEAPILGFSHNEMLNAKFDDLLTYGCYPKNLAANSNYFDQTLLQQHFKVTKPDSMQQLIRHVAKTSGALINYSQLAQECELSITAVNNYLSILERTLNIAAILPFVGKRRSEITSNPIYYFLDNGIRNQILDDFRPFSERSEQASIITNALFQELYKYRLQVPHSYQISYWRTKAGSKVDFILHINNDHLLPIVINYQPMQKPKLARGFRSFLDAYQPASAICITKNLSKKITFGPTTIHFLQLIDFSSIFPIIIDFLMGQKS